MGATSFHDYVLAVDRVEKRLLKVTAALDAAGIRYAVIGGNAVAAWVARVDPAATRSTKDVDLLVEERDLELVTGAMRSLGFTREHVMGLTLFTDPEEPSVRSGVHLVWAGQLVRPNYLCPAPSVDETIPDPQGFKVLSLPALVRMKLTSYRRIDQVHLEDMLRLGLVDGRVRSALPHSLIARLEEVERTMDEPMQG